MIFFNSDKEASKSEINKDLEQLQNRFGSSIKNSKKSSKITKKMYSIIQKGINYKEVVEITGREGNELSRFEIAGYVIVMYSWQNPGGSNMVVAFKDGKVQSKSQIGLK